MMVLYVQEQGAVVRREEDVIKVTLSPPKGAAKKERTAKDQADLNPAKATPAAPDQETQEQTEADQKTQEQAEAGQRAGKVLKKVSVRELEQVVLYGNVQLTSQAADLLLEHDVDVVYLSQYGKYRGRLGKDGSKFARLRHAQLNLNENRKRTLAVAKAIVQAKLANQSNLLQQLANRQGKAQADRLLQAGRAIEKLRKDSTRAHDDDTLRGFEGKAAVHYFDCFKLLLPSDWKFDGRAYYPPPDAFNALLSLGYALLQKDIHAVAQLVGLDPYIGCFHTLEYGRPSLVLDLMEEFRPLVVDRPLLTLALSRQLTLDAFAFTERKERPVELREKNLPMVIQAYEQRLETIVQHTASRTQQKLRRCFELQARIYARVVMEARGEYEGLVA